MKLLDFKRDLDYFSGKLSEINRQLVFAGIAVVWIFRIPVEGSLSIPESLIWPLIFFSLSMVVDLTHYFSGYVIWKTFLKNKENEGCKSNDDVTASASNKFVIDFFFYVKIVLNIIGFGLLFKFLVLAV